MSTLEDIVGRLGRQHSTAAVLLHHAVAEHLGLGPTDHKCFDLLRERGRMTASALVAITGLTSGAITGVVARLEAAGYLRREPDPEDGRQQILIANAERVKQIQGVFAPVRNDLSQLLESFDAHQLDGLAEFLERSTALVYRHIALLRGDILNAKPPLRERRSTQQPSRRPQAVKPASRSSRSGAGVPKRSGRRPSSKGQ